MSAKKTVNTPTENKNTAPENGYVIVSYENGKKGISAVSKGYILLENEVYAAGTMEESCAIAGIEFNPYGIRSFSKATLDEFSKREKSIKASESKIDKAFEKIAFDIYWINSKKAYVAAGYDTIVKYTDAKFGYGKTTCYSLISIVDRFAKRDENGAYLEEFDPIVKGYSVSKLSLMTGLTDEQITGNLKPAMSVRDIKAAVKAINEKAITDQSEEPDTAPESVQEETEEPDTVIESTAREVIHNTIITYKGAEDYMKNADYQHISSLVMRVINAHPEAVIELSYTLPAGN